jgi:hypothetical protein
MQEFHTNARNLLVLYDPYSVATEFVRQHLQAIKRHSQHNVAYAAATFDSRAEFPLELFDAVVVHFSVRMPFETMSPDFVNAVANFNGPKILLIQDEYDMPRKSCTLIRRLGIQTVFTTVPKEFVVQFYPPGELPNVKFKSCLTGYVPDELPLELVKPISERPVWLVYRGRKLPVWYGQLGFEKFSIAERMKAECVARSIPHDIEWEEGKRIGGPAWFSFVTNAKAVLGTESGSNVMDAWGDIRRGVEALSSERPDLSEEELYEASVAKFENNVRMNQISPKIFEAIALKTGLVLFEGSYSNIIKPDEHFIPLRKDYRNVDDVFNQLSDQGRLQAMVDRTYEDIVVRGENGYARFVKDIDDAIEEEITPGSPRPQLQTFALVRSDGPGSCWAALTPHLPLTAPIPVRRPDRPYVLSGRALDFWLALPPWLSGPIRAVLGPAARRLKDLIRHR